MMSHFWQFAHQRVGLRQQAYQMFVGSSVAEACVIQIWGSRMTMTTCVVREGDYHSLEGIPGSGVTGRDALRY